jgi:DNA-binding IclR family transcriptional regulator
MSEIKQKINTIVRASEILLLLSNGIGRIADVSKRLRLSKATTHRLLKTLQLTGFVAQDPVSRSYFLGPLIPRLASNPMFAHQHLIASSFERMDFLRNRTHETVVLQIRNGSQRMVLEEMLGLYPIRYYGGKGHSAPLYAGAAGKVLLSQLEDEELDKLLRSIQLVQLTSSTITDERVLRKELEGVRKKGYALSAGEVMAGSAAISVPVKNYFCPVAISVVGPDNRFLRKRMSFLEELKQGANQISEILRQTVVTD